MVGLISKRSNPISHSLINDLNHLFRCLKPRLVLSLIPLSTKMIDTTPKHHFEKNLVHDMKRISTHKLQCSHLIWIGHIPTQSICKLVPHRKRVRACKQKHSHVSHLSLSLHTRHTPTWYSKLSFYHLLIICSSLPAILWTRTAEPYEKTKHFYSRIQ